LTGHLDCSSNSITEPSNASELQWSIYPNPTSDQLNISAPSNGLWNCTLMNAAGQIIRSANANQPSIALECKDLAPGMYVVRAITANGESFSTPALIQR
ncbi:MAG: T9SS type A sorting domain-containing protein, partial [Crocinitomicaceae bacterium]|nr:T9SS type A sorting domain-containing protein [Crocinitomicaceae bacterium]